MALNVEQCKMQWMWEYQMYVEFIQGFVECGNGEYTVSMYSIKR